MHRKRSPQTRKKKLWRYAIGHLIRHQDLMLSEHIEKRRMRYVLTFEL